MVGQDPPLIGRSDSGSESEPLIDCSDKSASDWSNFENGKKTTEKERTQSRIQPNKQLPAIPQNVARSNEIPPKRDAIISTHPLTRKPLPLDGASTKASEKSLTEKSKPEKPQVSKTTITKNEKSKIEPEKSTKSNSKDSITEKVEKKSIHIVNDIPQEHRTMFAAAFGSIQKLRMPSSEDNGEKTSSTPTQRPSPKQKPTQKPTQKPIENHRERKRSSCEITLSQNNLHKIGSKSVTGSASYSTRNTNDATGSLEMTHGFSQNDLDQAEKLFKTDSKFASLFQAAEVSTSPSEDSEASSDSDNSSEDSSGAREDVKKTSRRGSRLQKLKQSGLRDSGISSNRNEDEELTILPMEVEIIQANRDEDERKKNKPRVKANSAGQEPPAVPPKPQYIRTFSMTSVSNASSMESVAHPPRNHSYQPSTNLNKEKSMRFFGILEPPILKLEKGIIPFSSHD